MFKNPSLVDMDFYVPSLLSLSRVHEVNYDILSIGKQFSASLR